MVICGNGRWNSLVTGRRNPEVIVIVQCASVLLSTGQSAGIKNRLVKARETEREVGEKEHAALEQSSP